MAVRLQDLGVNVATLAMLDAYPCDRWRGEAPPDETAALRALLLIAGVDPALLPGLPLTRPAVVEFLRTSGHLLGHLSDETLTGVVRVVHHNSRLVREHHHRKFDGDLLYFRAALDHQGQDLHPSEWAPYIGGVLEVVDVASLHAHLVGADAVGHIAPRLRGYLQP
jgi:enterobactin synthetase component F